LKRQITLVYSTSKTDDVRGTHLPTYRFPPDRHVVCMTRITLCILGQFDDSSNQAKQFLLSLKNSL